MKQLNTIVITFFIAIFIGACSQNVAATSEVKADHPAMVTYYKIRSYLAEGDIASAAKLSDDPAAFAAQYTRSLERKGEADFKAGMQRTINELKINSLRDSGDYSMILLDLPDNKYSPVAAVFFKRNGANQYLELAKPDLDIPCPLLDHMYAEKGEPDAKYVCKK